MMRFLSFLLLFFCFQGLIAQSYRLNNHIPVQNTAGSTLTGAWSGAMNNAQPSTIDLDGDGKLDIVYFDRLDQSFTPFLNTATQTGETSYTYAPEYKARFDSCDCFGWATFVDWNCDGREDLFCGMTVSNILVYEQVSYPDSFGFELRYSQIESQYGWGLGWLYAGKIDYPAIIDVDYDGDVDLLGFGISSNYIEWHRNLAVEQTGKCDTIILEQETRCWGHFYESNSNNTAFLFDTTSNGCALPDDFEPDGRGTDGNSARHEGSTTLLLDLNADSAYDALIGDVSFSDVYALYNAGNTQHAYFDSVETFFPQYDQPIDVSIFPANFYLDVNNDGKRDLVSAPNFTGGVEDIKGVNLYLNQGADNAPVFEFNKTGFLQDLTFDVGTGAAPTFFHYDGDSLLDLMIGNAHATYGAMGATMSNSFIHLYRNTGTAEAPAYQLVTDDFLDLVSGGLFPNLEALAPISGDVDGDGDEDILLGNNSGGVSYFKNTAPAGHSGTYDFITDNYGGVNVGANSAPFLYDIDNDLDLDLFVGNRTGHIAYYENKGSPQSANFVLIMDKWGGIKVNEAGGGVFSNGQSRPLLYDYDQDMEPELLLGGQPGEVFIYENVANAQSDTLQYVGNLFDFDFGSYSSPTVAVLDTSGYAMYVVGNRRGGLQLFSVSSAADSIPDSTNTALEPILAAALQVSLYPNPAHTQVRLLFEGRDANASKEIDILTLMGQSLYQEQTQAAELTWDLSGFAAGLYYVRIQMNGKQWVEKLMVRH